MVDMELNGLTSLTCSRPLVCVLQLAHPDAVPVHTTGPHTRSYADQPVACNTTSIRTRNRHAPVSITSVFYDGAIYMKNNYGFA